MNEFIKSNMGVLRYMLAVASAYDQWGSFLMVV